MAATEGRADDEADDEADDLGAVLHRLLSVVVEREEPILRAHGLGMWEYSVLTALGSGAATSQTELRRRTGRDATRLIAHLDELGGRGLLMKEVDKEDRRRNLVVLTSQGRELLRSARADIRSMEEDLLAGLPPQARGTLRRLLAAVAEDLPDRR